MIDRSHDLPLSQEPLLVFLQAADRSVGANYVRAAFDRQAFRAFFCGEG
jgi:hypothetical protein